MLLWLETLELEGGDWLWFGDALATMSDLEPQEAGGSS